jgi:AmpE protein
MSLISLLLALAAERYLSTSLWQFNEYYQRYQKLFERLKLARNSIFSHVLFIIVPVLICYFLLSVVSDGLLHFVISTLVLIICFGCVSSRELYKKYLMSAFRGETEQCEGYYRQLLADKNLPDLGFGQSLIWLNYRYFIAIMLFFMVFGAPGALCYRLLTKINEDTAQETQETQGTDSSQQLSTDPIEQYSNRIELAQQILFWLDWLPSRIVAFGYMLVGHFSKALPVWLENLFEFNKSPQTVLVTVAEKSEDFMIDDDDCTAEPCLLVRLAKRTLLLCLAFIAILILTGIIN